MKCERNEINLDENICDQCKQPAQIIVSKMVCERPPLTSDIRQVSKSSNGTAAARNTGAKLLLSSAETEKQNHKKYSFKMYFQLMCFGLRWAGQQFDCMILSDRSPWKRTFLCAPTGDGTPLARFDIIITLW